MEQGSTESQTSARESDDIPVLILGGPTGSGKNGLALSLACHYALEIINADSRQVYGELRIGTNRPTEQEMQGVPHHLFGFLPPNSPFSAADFERTALPILTEVKKRKRLPVVVGGTGFYIKALLKGVWQAPPKDPKLRRRLRDSQRQKGPQHLHQMLQKLDPTAASKIAPPDTYRVIRALEVYFQTGKRRADLPVNQLDRFVAVKRFINIPRQQLYANIERRTDQMLARGWIEEVTMLLEKYSDFAELPAARSLGYAEVIAYIRGEMSLAQCRDRIVLRTKQYAKRQTTWFRNQDGFEPLSDGHLLHKIVESLQLKLGY